MSNQKKQQNPVLKNTAMNGKTCYGCGLKGHILNTCPIVAANGNGPLTSNAIKQLRSALFGSSGPSAAELKAAKDRVAVQAKRDANLQKQAAQNRMQAQARVLAKALAPSGPALSPKVVTKAMLHKDDHKGVSGWRTAHEGVPVIGSKLREGHAETRSMGEDLCVRGTERLGPVGLDGTALTAGTVMANVLLNPAAFGIRLPLLALPYSKFEFVRVRLHYIGMISDANQYANGGLYIGFNDDPDSPVPIGNNGLNAMSTWGRNTTVTPVFNESKWLDLALKPRKATEPMFVDTTGDQRFSVQGEMVILAGQDFPAVTQNFGQWFIEYECRLMEINQPSALMNCLSIYFQGTCNTPGLTGNDLLPLPGDLSGTLTKVIGDSSLTTVIPAGVYGANLMLNRAGVYIFDVIGWCLTDSALATNDFKVLAITKAKYGDAAVPGPTVFDDTFLAGFEYGGDAIINAQGSGNTWVGDTGVSSSPGGLKAFFASSITVQAEAGATVMLSSWPGLSGAGGVDVGIKGRINIMRVVPDIEDDIVYRTSPQQIDVQGQPLYTAWQSRMLLDAPVMPSDIDVQTRLAFTEYCASVNDYDKDAVYVNALIDCFGLKLPLRKVGPTACHPGLSVLLWLVRTLGPIVAAKMLGVAESKLKEWLGEKSQAALDVLPLGAPTQQPAASTPTVTARATSSR